MTRDHHPVEPESVELVVRNLCRTLGGHRIHSNLSFSIRSGEILFVNGPSGVGKSVLLRALASLDPIDSGSLTLNDKTPDAWTAPRWRSLVTYVHQQRIQHPGTPSQLYFRLQQLGTQRHRPRADLPTIISDFGLEAGVLNQPWQELSGGQAQRASLGIALALKPAILLLDEPTSSLDPATVKRVERVLKNCGSAVIWVSHDPGQLDRVGGRVLNLPSGTEGQVGSPTKSKPGSSSAPAAEE